MHGGIALRNVLAATAAAMAALLPWRAEAATYLVGAGEPYATIQAALDAAKGAAGDHTIRITDSASYAESVAMNSSTGSFTAKSIVVEAAPGQTPKLHSFKANVNMTTGSLTLRGLTFDGSLLGAVPTNALGALTIGYGDAFRGQVTIEKCTFNEGAAAPGGDSSWGLLGIYFRINDASKKVTVSGCTFNMLSASGHFGMGSHMGPNQMAMEVRGCLFKGFGGISEANTSDTAAPMNIHSNVFYSLNQGFFKYYHPASLDLSYLTIENNTFIRCGGNSLGTQGAAVIRRNGNIDAAIRDNLIVNDNTNTYDGLCAFSDTDLTHLKAEYNAFVAMKNGKVGYWKTAGYAAGLRTLADLNAMPGAGNNQLNDTLTPEQLFVDYAGGDYRLKTGVWAATAASDGQFVGAFDVAVKPVKGFTLIVK